MHKMKPEFINKDTTSMHLWWYKIRISANHQWKEKPTNLWETMATKAPCMCKEITKQYSLMRYDTSVKVLFSANSSIGKPLYLRIPASPSM